MKRKIALLFLLAVFVAANGQQYRKSFGIVAGTLDGISYKEYVKGYEHFAFQFDAYWQWGYMPEGVRKDYRIDGNPKSYSEYTYISDFPSTQYQATMLSFSFLCQKVITQTEKGVWNWYLGGGFGLGGSWGYELESAAEELKPNKTSRPWLKLEQHLLGGVEYSFSGVPLVLGMDVRPGMAENLLIKGIGANREEIHQISFDWGVNLTLRYCFGDKKKGSE